MLRVVDIVYVPRRIDLFEFGPQSHVSQNLDMYASLVQSCSVWLTSEGVPSVFNFGVPLELSISPSLDCATACVGIGGVIYSNFRESRVNVMGPYTPPQLIRIA